MRKLVGAVALIGIVATGLVGCDTAPASDKKVTAVGVPLNTGTGGGKGGAKPVSAPEAAINPGGNNAVGSKAK